MKIANHISNIKNDENYRYTYVIAEIGINHNGCIDEAIKLIEAASINGVDAVKFQKRDLQSLYTKTILKDPNSAEWTFEYLLPILEECELTEEEYFQIKNKCEECNLDLIITPFDIKSANFCHNLGISAFKIGSADMVNYDLVKHCFDLDLPVFISTGMWTESEIQKSIDNYKEMTDGDFFMFLANSTYPMRNTACTTAAWFRQTDMILYVHV